MALSQSAIEIQIGALIDSTSSLKLQESKDQFKTQLSAIIVAAIQSATIVFAPGTIVVVGSAVTQTNPSPVIGTLT